MVEIIPAVMPYSYRDLVEKCTLAATVCDRVQIDVMDGMYVPSKSWPYDTELSEQYHHIVTGESSLPESATLSFVADLMVSNPETVAYEWVKAGADRIIVHLESLQDQTSADFIIQLKQETGVEIGVAIGTATGPEALSPFLPHIDVVQCMGIEKIGYQGQEFDSRVLDQIKYVREQNSDMPITIDGSVNTETIPQLISAGATRLVVGSALFGQDNIVESYKGLQEVVEGVTF